MEKGRLYGRLCGESGITVKEILADLRVAGGKGVVCIDKGSVIL